ncbi:S9 family peptidase [Coralliovum pocilloporae]|uniref:S9 family peptidase n=1 Tax=Coralliovum pocilloporae TaxID=3066369 RepID=UPI00330790D8
MTKNLLPPRAEKRPVTATHHGITKTDDYDWLRAGNWQEVMHDPSALPADIRAYLEAENAYTEEQMADTDALQEQLFKEMKGRIKEDDSSVPAPDGPYDYASRFVEGGQYPIAYRIVRDTGEEAVLLDGNREAEGVDYFRLAALSHSPDHAFMAWSVDDKGSEYFTIRIRDIETGQDLDDVIERTTGGMVWSADSQTLFYTWQDDNHRPCKVYRHRLGTASSEDVLIYEEQDPGFFVGLGKTQSGAYIMIDCHDHDTSEVHLIPADKPDTAPVLMAERVREQEYAVDHAGDTFFILTNRDGAEDFKLMTAPAEAPGRENWQDLVPHQSGCLILSHCSYRNHLVRLERQDGLPRIVIRRLSDGEEHAVSFDEEAYGLGMSSGYEFDTTSFRFTYSSMTTPAQTFDYDMESRARVLRKQQEIPSGHNPDDYVTRRLMAPSHDGELVPVTLLYRKDTKLDGTAPCLLYGYGSYGIAIPAGFSITPLSLVDRGFVYAIAHIRGGKEKGFRWYLDGRKDRKINTFLDFIAAGDHLVSEGFTSRGRIVAEGGSAGGMLMGAVANMRPDLFSGILALVPFVDVLNTILDDTLPLTPPEWPEWGNPITSPDDYRYIASYSPYDQVSAQDYPAIFAIGGLTDPRVTYWEPAKWVARLRDTRTDDNLLLLKINMGSGHGGASGRFDRLKETALEYAFALKVSG